MQNFTSFYIPFMMINTTVTKIHRVFYSLNIGIVEKVDFVERHNKYGMPYKSAFVHVNKWFDNTVSSNLKTKIIHPTKTAKIIYNDPYYWVLKENNSFYKRKLLSSTTNKTPLILSRQQTPSTPYKSKRTTNFIDDSYKLNKIRKNLLNYF